MYKLKTYFAVSTRVKSFCNARSLARLSRCRASRLLSKREIGPSGTKTPCCIVESALLSSWDICPASTDPLVLIGGSVVGIFSKSNTQQAQPQKNHLVYHGP